MLKKKIIPVFLASALTVSGTTGFVTEAFSENVYAAEEVHTERLADFADLLDDGQEEELEANWIRSARTTAVMLWLSQRRLWMVQFRRIMQMISLIIMTMAWERTRVVYCFLITMSELSGVSPHMERLFRFLLMQDRNI